MATFKLELSEQTMAIISQALENTPYRIAIGAINEINQQIAAQRQRETELAAENKRVQDEFRSGERIPRRD